MNNLSGEVPSCLGNLSLLRQVYMSENEFSDNIASVLWFRKGVSNAKKLIELDLSNNEFYGKIPSTISQLENLVRLVLSRNKLNGHIVKSLTALKDLQYLDLSHNNLSGSIPKSLQWLAHLNHCDVSFNELRGKIPERGCFFNFTADFFAGNKGLCGATRFNVKKCIDFGMRAERILSYVLKLILLYIEAAFAICIFIIALIIYYACFRDLYQEDLASKFNKFTPSEILEATGNLSEENMIAKGEMSSVYLGRFSDDKVYALKVFDSDVQVAVECFDTETLICSMVRHRNLIKVYTCCSKITFKALVMKYMPNSDLEKWLYSTNCSLNLFERLRIMKDVACALEHLHFYHNPTIVHCDINPNNIMLDEDMVAHVGDLGIAKILGEEEERLHSRALGTIGYIAPECGSSQQLVSTAMDVYSYGIVLLETLSRRKPTDEMFTGELTLRKWVSESITEFVSTIVENELMHMHTEETRVTIESWLTLAVKLALDCCQDLPIQRPDMTHVVSRMVRINSNFNNVLHFFLH